MPHTRISAKASSSAARSRDGAADSPGPVVQFVPSLPCRACASHVLERHRAPGVLCHARSDRVDARQRESPPAEYAYSCSTAADQRAPISRLSTQYNCARAALPSCRPPPQPSSTSDVHRLPDLDRRHGRCVAAGRQDGARHRGRARHRPRHRAQAGARRLRRRRQLLQQPRGGRSAVRGVPRAGPPRRGASRPASACPTASTSCSPSCASTSTVSTSSSATPPAACSSRRWT